MFTGARRTRPALAEAEIEYGEDACDSIYVRFKLTADPNGVLAKAGIPLENAYVVIWSDDHLDAARQRRDLPAPGF